MSTHTVCWMIDVDLEPGATIEDHARHAAEICCGIDLDDPGGANAFCVAVRGGRAERLLREAGELAARVDFGSNHDRGHGRRGLAGRQVSP